MTHTKVETGKLKEFVKNCKLHIAKIDVVDLSDPDKAVTLLADEMNRFDELLYNFMLEIGMKDAKINKPNT